MDHPNGLAAKQSEVEIMESVKLSDPKLESGASIERDEHVSVDVVNDGSKLTTPTGKSRKSVSWSEDLVESRSVNTYSSIDGGNSGGSSNPYVAYTPAQNDQSSFNFKDSVESVRGVLGRWGKKVGEATKKAEVLAGNTWQHLKTAPSFTDAALGRIAQGTKVLAEGGYEKIFRQTFDTVPEEQLQNSFACYLSTSAGPVMGVLYVSTAKLAFCSDNPLSYKAEDKVEWSYYKVMYKRASFLAEKWWLFHHFCYGYTLSVHFH